VRRQNQSDQPLGDHPDVVACAEAFARTAWPERSQRCRSVHSSRRGRRKFDRDGEARCDVGGTLLLTAHGARQRPGPAWPGAGQVRKTPIEVPDSQRTRARIAKELKDSICFLHGRCAPRVEPTHLCDSLWRRQMAQRSAGSTASMLGTVSLSRSIHSRSASVASTSPRL